MTMNDRRAGQLRRYLRAECPLPEMAPEDWERLTRRIVSAGGPVLRVRIPRRSWREELMLLGKISVPVALAAGAAALVLLSHLESAVSKEAAMPSTAFLSAMAGETTRETVLDMTLGDPGQTWLTSEEK